MKIDITKKYRTRGGMPVIIHGFSNPVDGRPLVYSYQAGDGQWFLDSCDEGGSDMDGDRMFDLIEIREPREWIVRVGTKDNQVVGNGRIINEHPADSREPGDQDRWEIVRVREIL